MAVVQHGESSLFNCLWFSMIACCFCLLLAIGAIMYSAEMSPSPVAAVHHGTSPLSTSLRLSMIACCFCLSLAIGAIMHFTESARAEGAREYLRAIQKGCTAMKIATGAIAVCMFTAIYIVVQVK